MTEELKPKLTWFLNNLDLLIQDIQFEANDYKVEVYFDFSDVYTTLLGFRYYFGPGLNNTAKIFKVDSNKPLRDPVLVNCLAIKGYLGPIKMFPSHQAEFLRKLDKDFDIHDSPDEYKKVVYEFENAIKRIDTFRGATKLLNNTEDLAASYLENPNSVVNYFKVIQLIRGLTWRDRLIAMRKVHLLNLDSDQQHFRQILNSTRFKKLLAAFMQERPHVDERNNFADAVALTLLAVKLDEYRQGKKCVPSFYVAPDMSAPDLLPLFNRAIKLAELDADFSYTGFNDVPIKALRGADYFCFKALFSPLLASSSETDFLFTPDDLVELRKELWAIVEGSPNELQDKINFAVFKSGRTIIDLIDELNRLLFFRSVWMPSADQDEELALKDLHKAIDQLTTRELEAKVNEELDRDKDSLRENLQAYNSLVAYWEPFHEANIRLRNVTSKQISSREDHFLAFGLLRFGFPEKARDAIEKSLRNLLHGEDIDAEVEQYNAIAACYSARSTERRHVQSLMVAVAILWVAEQYEALSKLPGLLGDENLRHYSLTIVCAAASLISRREEYANKAFTKLEEAFKHATNPRKKADLAVGLAYLYFRKWENSYYSPWDHPPGTITKPSPTSENLIDQAFTMAKEAYRRLDDRADKKSYALNQMLYYMVKGGGNQRLGEMARLTNELLRFRSSGYWEHRFDDTIAHYYHRLAVLAADREDWPESLKMIEKAIQASIDACKPASWDQASLNYKKVLEALQVQYTLEGRRSLLNR